MKIRSLIALFGIFFFLSGISLSAQEGLDFNPKNVFGSPVSGPSPTAAALAKYGNIPVGYYTGTPSISIPLYTIAGKQLSLPIGLSYHAGGIKVDEVASNAGLGWSLNAGGVITRSIKDKADEIPSTGSFDFQMSDPPTSTELTQAVSLADAEPDIFFFNFAGYSGKFVLQKSEGNLQAVVIPYQDIKISVNAKFLMISGVDSENCRVKIFRSKTNTQQVNTLQRSLQQLLLSKSPTIKAEKI